MAPMYLSAVRFPFPDSRWGGISLPFFLDHPPQSGSPMSVLSITVFGCARPSRFTSRASRHKNGCASFTKCVPLKSSTCNCPVRPAPSAHPAILRSTCRSAELSLPFTMRCLQVSCREAPRTVSRVPAFFTRTVVCAWHSIMAIAQMEKRIIRFIGNYSANSHTIAIHA